MSAILVTGGAGLLGHWLTRRLEREFPRVVATTHNAPAAFERAEIRAVDLASRAETEALLREIRPRAILHTAALTDTGACEKNPEAARAANVEATRHLLEAARALAPGAPPPWFLFTSTDLVFNGASAPYDEDAPTAPVMYYGRTKVEAEALVRAYPGPWTILRPALIFGPPAPRRPSFLEWILGPLRRGENVRLFTDEWRTPVDVADVVEVICRLLAGPPRAGIFHCGGAERLSRYEMGLAVARLWGLEESLLTPSRQSDVTLACPRPRDVSLNSDRLARTVGYRPRGFREAIARLRGQI